MKRLINKLIKALALVGPFTLATCLLWWAFDPLLTTVYAKVHLSLAGVCALAALIKSYRSAKEIKNRKQ